MSTNYDKWGHEPVAGRDKAQTFRAALLSAVTVVLLLVGTLFWIADLVGWAQAVWVVASGLSGASVVLWIEHYW